VVLHRTVTVCWQCCVTVTAVTDTSSRNRELADLQFTIYNLQFLSPQNQTKNKQQHKVDGKRGTCVAKHGRSFSWKWKKATGLLRTQTKKQHDRRYHAHERGVESWSRGTGPTVPGSVCRPPYWVTHSFTQQLTGCPIGRFTGSFADRDSELRVEKMIQSMATWLLTD